jgi:hypothetical protein
MPQQPSRPLRPLPAKDEAIAPSQSPASIETTSADGRECVDPGDAPSRSYVGVFNPTSQKQALAQALGLNALERSKALRGSFMVNVAAAPDVLKLDVKKKFTIKNFGKDLDGSWTVEEILILFGDVLQMKIWAFKEDAGAPAPQIFGTDAAAFFPPPPTPEPVQPEPINPPAIAPEKQDKPNPSTLSPEFHQLPDLGISDADANQFKVSNFTQSPAFTLTDWNAGNFGAGQTLWDTEKKEAIASKKDKFSPEELPSEMANLIL